MSTQAIQFEALSRARSSQSISNYTAILRGFIAKGIPESEISPRENVFTFNAWKALGRVVRKGEHGVRILTFITTKDKRTGQESRRPWSTTVFHVSQTEPTDIKRAYHYPASNLNLTEILPVEPDATPENVPYAGEDEPSRESGLDDAIVAHIQPPVEPVDTWTAVKFSPDATVDEVKTDREQDRLQRLSQKYGSNGARRIEAARKPQTKTVEF